MRLLVKKQIHSSFSSVSLDDVWLERRFDLPFAPFVGLNLVDGEWNCNIEELIYDISKEEFVAYTESNTEIYYAALNKINHRPIEEIVAEYEMYGWAISALRLFRP